jgi:hypothetical protein
MKEGQTLIEIMIEEWRATKCEVFHIFSHTLVRSVHGGICTYWSCPKCGRRWILGGSGRGGGYFAVDRQWIESGKFSDMTHPPISASVLPTPRA